MERKIIWRNFIKNKTVTLTTVLFIAAAALLLSLAAMLSANLSGAIDRLMQKAETPHFMQMHSGVLDEAELDAFAKGNAEVADYQTLHFLNVEGGRIILGNNSLADSLQDNGFCTQSGRFDFLLGLDDQPVRPDVGELYVPVCYLKDGTAKAGDPAVICGRSFVIAGFVRDSQMNSTLASSKRFVVNQADYEFLEPFGSPETLIEFRLHDLSGLGAFEAAYSSANLPANGPALTWPLFKMMSAISDGVMIAVILLIGVLILLIALLCVRFTLMAKLEDDYREIGVMRAVGMRVSHVKGIYLSIYGVMALSGGALGWLLSIPLQYPLRQSIRINLGDGGAPAYAFGAAGAAFLISLVLLYVGFNLQRIRKISVAQALRFGAGRASGRTVGFLQLSKNGWLSANFFLAFQDILARKRLYATMLAVSMLTCFIVIVPHNLYQTISGENFISYLGVGECDLRFDIQQIERMDARTAELSAFLASDPYITGYTVLTTKIFPLRLENGEPENLKVELGDHSVFPLRYVEGRMPLTEQEIALSAIQMKELNKHVGENLTLITGAGEKRLTICGIYSDITNGGKTAKAVFTDNSTEAMWNVACAKLTDPTQLACEVERYTRTFPDMKVSNISEYVRQTFGQTLEAVRASSMVAAVMSAAVILLVTLLFIRLLVAKDRYSIAVMRSIGFTASDISRQYGWRSGLVLFSGMISGTVLAGTLGEKLAGLAISSLGVAAFHFTINPVSTYLLCPLFLLFAAFLGTAWGTCRAGETMIYEAIKE